MNEYVINFINDQGVYQQLTFRGVSEGVAFALAKGLLDSSFDQVSLSAKEYVDRTIDIVPGQTAPLPDNPEAEGATGEPGVEPDLGGTVEEPVEEPVEEIPMSAPKKRK